MVLLSGKQSRKWVKALIVALPVLAIAGSFIPLFPGSALFESVGARDGEQISIRGLADAEFIIAHGSVYLLRQQTWQAIALVTYCRKVKWDVAKVRALRQRYPELDREELWQ